MSHKKCIVIPCESVGKDKALLFGGVDVKTLYSAEKVATHLEDVKAKKEDWNQKKRVLQDEAETLKAKRNFLTKFYQLTGERFAKRVGKDDTTLDKVTETLTYIGEQLDSLATLERENALQQEKITDEIEALNKQIKQSGNPTVSHNYELHIVVEVQASIELTLEVTYQVDKAYWKPLYDVRLLTDDNEVELTYIAEVSQNTGEDWEEVNLSLSTASVTVTKAPKELPVWWVGRSLLSRRSPRYDNYMAFDMSLSDAEDFERIEDLSAHVPVAPAPEEARVATPAEIAQMVAMPKQTTSATYQVGTPVTIPADKEPHKSTVVITRLPVDLDYVSIPKLTTDTYLRATVTNDTDYIFLAGQASIFHDADFVGKTNIEQIVPDEEFKVSLGVQERIKGRARIGESGNQPRVDNRQYGQTAVSLSHHRHESSPAKRQNRDSRSSADEQSGACQNQGRTDFTCAL